MTTIQYLIYAALSTALCMCGYCLGEALGRCRGELEALLRLLDVVFGGGDDE